MIVQQPVRDTFRKSGLRHTRQRELVFVSLASIASHPTAEELHGLLTQSDSKISLATIYNTLDALVQSGLCRKLPSLAGGGACRYDADLSSHVHVSTPRGEVMDVPTELSDRLLEGMDHRVLRDIEARLGIQVAGVSVQIVAK